jgi:hypothetical protein
MRAKVRVTSAVLVTILSMLLASFIITPAGAQDDESELQNISLRLYGDEESGHLNSSYSDLEEHHVYTTNITDGPTIPISIGEWQTEPLVSPLVIDGEVYFILFAKGNLQQVTFSAYLTVNGVDITPEMDTDPQDLTENMTAMYISYSINVTQAAELSNSDIIGFDLWMTHNDPSWYVPPPLGTGGKNVTLVMGGYTASYVNFFTNSTRVEEIKGRDDPDSGNMIITATIKCSFGVEDFYSASARTKSTYGNKFYELSNEIIDEATVQVEWEWEYSVTDGGSYPVTVTARDQNGKRWEKTEEIHITTPFTEVDFSITDSDISFSNDPEKDENTTITAKVKGLGRRWNSYQVEVDFFDGNTLIESVKTSISRTKTNEVSVLWVPVDEGNHAISINIDPNDNIGETDEGNNEASTIVEVKKGSGGNGTPGFETLFLLAAIGFAILVKTRTRGVK